MWCVQDLPVAVLIYPKAPPLGREEGRRRGDEDG